MKIGIDCQSMAGPASGLGHYTQKLTEWLPQVDHRNEYRFFHCGERFGARTYDRLLWENCILPFQVVRQKIDLLYVPAFAMPWFKGIARRTVVMVHDLIGIIFSDHLSPPSRFYWSKWLPSVNRNADRIIANSECTRGDIVRYMGVDPKKIRVVPLAADERFSPERDEGKIIEVCSKYSIRRPFVLFLGNVEPRKNLPRLIRAFGRLRVEKRVEHQLVIAGSRSWRYPELVELCRDPEVKESVKFVDYVDGQDLVSMYQASEALVFPSLYEGFGFPILEAMACGVPVIASRVASIPEVGGDAVYYVNPYDEEEIARALHEVLTDRALRQELRRRGFERIRQFSWRRTAEETRRIFEELSP